MRALSKKFINKDMIVFPQIMDIDVVGATDKTQCSYGGVTLSDNNSTMIIRIYLVIYGFNGRAKSNENRINAVKTKKKNITFQEFRCSIKLFE
ncbi:exotoxin OB-fold domain-containing protein [Staphylococcus aureus]